MKTSLRIGIWLGCFLLTVTAFSLFFGAAFFVFRITVEFAFPVWVLYLPIVVLLKDAEKPRSWIILGSGLFIGPASLGLWGLILQLRGGDSHTIWQGDGIGLGVFQGMFYAAILGGLMAAGYVAVLKAIHRRFSF